MICLVPAHRRTRAAVAAVAAMLATVAQLSACGARGSASDPARSGSSHPDSGIRGRVLLGPTCPVERIGQTCVRPYKATIKIRSEATGRVVARTRSRANGRFSIPLAPGTYVLESQSGRPYPRSSPQTTTVHWHRYTRVLISYDSGIR